MQTARAMEGRRSREEWRRLAREYEASGLTRREFGERAGISPAALDYQRRRQREEDGTRLVEVEVGGGVAWPRGGWLTLELGNGRRIEVRPGFDAETLARLLAVADAGRP